MADVRRKGGKALATHDKNPGSSVRALSKALLFAAEAHANQRRKGAAQEPYINHLIEVHDLVAQATGGSDIELLTAALLHDVIEDTDHDRSDIANMFGERVADIVVANSDDMSIAKAERKRSRIAAMAAKNSDARIVKMADVISNLRAIVTSPPAGWPAEWRLGYVENCRQLIDAGRGANPTLEKIFDQTAADAERAIRDAAPFEFDGRERAVKELESGVGQPVHLIHLPNTEAEPIDDRMIDAVFDLVSQSFASVILQRQQAILEGRRREILTVRIRTDSTDAVVALAQKMCQAFRQRFVGVEMGGRYIRIYSDDTE